MCPLKFNRKLTIQCCIIILTVFLARLWLKHGWAAVTPWISGLRLKRSQELSYACQQKINSFPSSFPYFDADFFLNILWSITCRLAGALFGNIWYLSWSTLRFQNGSWTLWYRVISINVCPRTIQHGSAWKERAKRVQHTLPLFSWKSSSECAALAASKQTGLWEHCSSSQCENLLVDYSYNTLIIIINYMQSNSSGRVKVESLWNGI